MLKADCSPQLMFLRYKIYERRQWWYSLVENPNLSRMAQQRSGKLDDGVRDGVREPPEHPWSEMVGDVEPTPPLAPGTPSLSPQTLQESQVGRPLGSSAAVCWWEVLEN